MLSEAQAGKAAMGLAFWLMLFFPRLWRPEFHPLGVLGVLAVPDLLLWWQACRLTVPTVGVNPTETTSARGMQDRRPNTSWHASIWCIPGAERKP
jgi:hypothetical protein